jgi:hypothetical protein
MEGLSEQQLSKALREKLDSDITYFRNYQHQMRYPRYRAAHLPIGSGVTEAACKTLVKQRLCRSGMRWRERGEPQGRGNFSSCTALANPEDSTICRALPLYLRRLKYQDSEPPRNALRQAQ